MIDEENLKRILDPDLTYPAQLNGSIVAHATICSSCRRGLCAVKFFKIFLHMPFCAECYPKIVAVAEADEKVKAMARQDSHWRAAQEMKIGKSPEPKANLPED